MNLSLNGHTAVVCGSSQGIGLATAQELALLGCSCILVARNEVSLKESLATLAADAGQKHSYFIADFSLPEKLKETAARELAGKTISILVNNTGGPPAGPITDAAEEDFIDTFNRHVICAHVLSKIVVPGMRQQQFGRIINIISTSVRIPLRNLGVSNTIRGAMASWAKTMSNELAGDGITVNNVLPGFTKTQRLEVLIKNMAAKRGISEEEITKEMQTEVPARRFADAAEVASMAAFLATPAASYINGVSIPVDGGRTGSI